MNRVVITGMGVIAPNGNGLDAFVANTLAGKVGIKKISKFDAHDTGITVAGEIDDFDPRAVVGKKAARRMDLYSQYAVQTAAEAVEMAGINADNTNPEEMGVIYGSGIGGLTRNKLSRCMTRVPGGYHRSSSRWPSQTWLPVTLPSALMLRTSAVPLPPLVRLERMPLAKPTGKFKIAGLQ